MKFFIQIFIILIGIIICSSCLNNKKENSTVSGTPLSEEKTENLNSKKLELEEEVIEIELEYIGLMCPCPQWATPENIELYYSVLGTKKEFSMDSVFMILERKNDSILYPFKIEGWDGEDVFILKGQFYKNRRKWTGEDGVKWNSRVFRYEGCKAVSKKLNQ
jgi:hypothetical protein